MKKICVPIAVLLLCGCTAKRQVAAERTSDEIVRKVKEFRVDSSAVVAVVSLDSIRLTLRADTPELRAAHATVAVARRSARTVVNEKCDSSARTADWHVARTEGRARNPIWPLAVAAAAGLLCAYCVRRV